MGTTALSVLQSGLGTLIGDSNREYSSNYTDAINNASKETFPNLFIPIDDTDGLTIVEGDYRYELPSDFQDGALSRVQIEIYSDETDLDDARWETIYGWEIIPDGTTKNLRLPYLYAKDKIIRLIGYKPLEELSDSSDTISIDGEQVNLLLAYAGGKLFQMESQALQYTIDTITTDISDIEDDVGTSITDIDAIKTEVATETTGIASVDGEIATEDTNISGVQTNIDAVITKIATVDVEIATEDTAITGVQTNIDTVITSIATEETALDIITTAIATANNGVNNVAASIATTQLVIDTAVDAIATAASEDISRYEAVIARNQAQIDRKVAIRDQETAKRDYLLIKRDAKATDIGRLDDDIKRMVDARERYRDKRARLIEERGGLDDDIKRMMDSRERIQDKRNRLITEKAGLVDDITRLDDKRKRLDDEIVRDEAKRTRYAQKRNEVKDRMVVLDLRSQKWFVEYRRLLPRLAMAPPSRTLNIGW